MNTLSPGDLTVAQIRAAFAAIWAVRGLALGGHDEATIAQTLEWRREDVREAARIQGFSVSPLVLVQHVCPVCGSLMTADGLHCEVCRLRKRLERLVAANVREHEREVERLERECDSVKQDTKRCRERMGTNPRMKTLSGWILYLAEQPREATEEVMQRIDEARLAVKARRDKAR